MKISSTFALCLLVFIGSSTQAVVTTTGSVSPDDPSSWTSSTGVGIGGYSSVGTITVDGGSVIFSRSASLYHHNPTATTTVTITGAGSTWNNSQDFEVWKPGNCELYINDGGTLNIGEDLYIPNDGSCFLSISTGGTVNVAGRTMGFHGYSPPPSGAIHFNNGTLNTHALYAVSNQLTGNGTINTNGMIADADLIFDTVHGRQATFTLNQPNQNITVNLDNRSDSKLLGAGNIGKGSLTIKDGIIAECREGYLGYKPGSTGTATVSGPGSTWTNEDLHVGYEGTGELNVTNGGTVKALNNTYLGCGPDSSGKMTVSGTGSILQCDHGLEVGDGIGTGKLLITDGGTVINHIGSIHNQGSSVTVSGNGSTWTNQHNLYVGNERGGRLNILDGGTVNVANNTNIGFRDDYYGIIHFDNGTLDTGSLVANPSYLTGTGTIHTGNIVLKGQDLLFDANHGLQQTFTLSGDNQNVTIHLDHDGRGSLGAGYIGRSTLTIKDGRAIECERGYIGSAKGTHGIATVSGEGSSWTTLTDFNMGGSGYGELNITHGATVTTCYAHVGNGDPFGDPIDPSAQGIVNVSGNGSTWAVSDSLTLGSYNGRGTLNISDGATVNIGKSLQIAVDAESSGNIHFDNGTLNVGSLPANLELLTGTGTINAHGMVVSNADLVFDTTDNLHRTFALEGPNQNITINLDPDSSGDLGVKSRTLTIQNGCVIESHSGYISNSTDSTGKVIVSGVGSHWNGAGGLVIGQGDGISELHITNGGLVSFAQDLLIGEDDYIYLSSGGMLALYDEWMDEDSLHYFAALRYGYSYLPKYSRIQLWNDTKNSWTPLSRATRDVDYTFETITGGDLDGYMLLTVGSVPEPGGVTLLLSAILAMGWGWMRRRRRV